MGSNSDEIAIDFTPFMRIYKDSRIERLSGNEIIPVTTGDPKTGVSTKDVIIVPETGVSARLFLPKITDSLRRKLPLLVYFHGGAFCIETPFSPLYDRYVKSIVAEANVVAVSVHYRRAPEHLLPIAYDDSWTALQWVASHSDGKGPESWLNDYADLGRVFLVGESAGGNIVHNMGVRAAEMPLEGVGIVGLGIMHPFFYAKEPMDSEVRDNEKNDVDLKLWMMICPSSTGCNDPLINPATCTNLKGLPCKRVVVWVAEKDKLKGAGLFYHKTLLKSGWKGEVELAETQGEDHGFHVFNPTNDKAVAMTAHLASWINKD